MERAEFDYGGDVVPEVVVAVLADPQRRACAVYGRERTEAAARTVVSQLVDAMGPDVGLDFRNRFEWLLRLPRGSGFDALFATLRRGLAATSVDVEGARVFVDFAYGISSGSVSGADADSLVRRPMPLSAWHWNRSVEWRSPGPKSMSDSKATSTSRCG